MTSQIACMLTYPIPNKNFYNSFQTELIEPALKGTLNVLRSCAKDPSIKRVVITSSMAAVAFNGKPLAPDVLIDETWFSDAAFCEKSKVHICSNFLLDALFSKFFSECYIWQFLWLHNGLSVTSYQLQLSFFFIFAFLFPLDGFSPILYYGCSLLE